jgi:hypothetical protein
MFSLARSSNGTFSECSVVDLSSAVVTGRDNVERIDMINKLLEQNK